jgi:hypothetical protein
LKCEKALINSSLKVLCEESTVVLVKGRFHFAIQNGPSIADRNQNRTMLGALVLSIQNTPRSK